MSRRLRLSRRNLPGWAYAIARTPSHLTSNDHCDSGLASVFSTPGSASIGTILAGIGSRSGSAGGSIRWIIQSLAASGPRPIGNSP